MLLVENCCDVIDKPDFMSETAGCILCAVVKTYFTKKKNQRDTHRPF